MNKQKIAMDKVLSEITIDTSAVARVDSKSSEDKKKKKKEKKSREGLDEIGSENTKRKHTGVDGEGERQKKKRKSLS